MEVLLDTVLWRGHHALTRDFKMMDGPARRVLVDELDLKRIFPAARIPGAMFAAMRPERLLVGLMMVLFLVAVGRGWDGLGTPHIEVSSINGAEVLGDFDYTQQMVMDGLGQISQGVLAFDTAQILDGVKRIFIQLPSSLWNHSRSFLVMYGLVLIFVLGIVGGGVARLEAERFGVEREVKLADSMRWAFQRWKRLTGVILLPPILILSLLVIPWFMGVLTYFPVLDVLISLVWGIALVFAFVAALLMAAWCVSIPILIPAAACETGDPGETIVRSAGLVWRRPFSLLLYLVVAIISGVLGWLIVSGLVVFTLDSARYAGALCGSDFMAHVPGTQWPSLADVPLQRSSDELGMTENTSLGILNLWRTFVLAIGYGWLFSFFITAGTRVYLLQRSAVEGISEDDLGSPGPVG